MKEKLSKHNTNHFIHLLFDAVDPKAFIKDNEEAMGLSTFSEYITLLCKEREMVPEHVIKRSDIERSYGHQLFKGTRHPSRDTVIKLAFGFSADVDTAQTLLRHAGMCGLHPKIKRDAAVLYCLHHRFSIIETQQVLYEIGLPLLGNRRQT